MKNLIAFILIILPALLFSQSLIYPKLPSDCIVKLHFINENEVIFINEGGSIFKSHNGGNSWDLKATFTNTDLQEMHFLNDQTGFIKASSGLIYTTDGGENWSHEQISLYGIAFLPLSESRIIKSVQDNGIHLLDNFFNDWTATYLFKVYTDSSSDYIIDLPFGYITQFEALPSGSVLALGINENAFYSGLINDSLSIILKSSDFGSSWDTVWNGLADFMTDFSFNNDSIGWMSSYKTIYKTLNGGISWISQNIPEFSNAIVDIYAINDSDLYAVTLGSDAQFIKSENSGETWNIYNIDIPGYYKNHISFYDENLGFLFGSELIKTIDGGLSWSQIDTSLNTDIYDLEFVSLLKGFALGSDGLYKTCDGGFSWTKNFPTQGPANDPGDILMLTNMKGWLITDDSLFMTINGGNTWDPIILSENIQLYQGVEFLDENFGILYSVSEEISPSIFEPKYHYITTDGGTTWIPTIISDDTSTAYSKLFNKMQFTDSTHLWAVNREGLWLSRDSAKTWESIFLEGYKRYSFHFYNSEIGIVTSSGHYFHFTNDGGKTWQTIGKVDYNSPTDCRILGPDIFNRYRVLEIGKQGNLFQYSIDEQGIVYSNKKLNTYTKNDLNKICVLEKDNFPYVWIAGEGFSVLYRQWELIHTGINDSRDQPEKYMLMQNYPNPFNSFTIIKFSIEKPALTELVIYNTLGQRIRTLLNEFKNTGSYEVGFDATGLSSGVYFYYLKSGSFFKIRKMLLVK